MDKLEQKAIPLTVDSLSKDSRTAVIAHATYDNIDRTKDICRPGMFNKSWSEHKADVKILVDHDPGQKPGLVTDLFETKAQAFTKVKFGNYTLGNDVLEMLDMGVIDSASFGFKAEKFNKLEIKGQKIRELKEVYHGETTICNALPPINPSSRVVLVTKAMGNLALELKALTLDEQSALKKFIDNGHANIEAAINLSKGLDTKSDLYTWIMYYISRQADGTADMRSQLRWGTNEMKAMKSYVNKLEKFCRTAQASDECIQAIEAELKAAQQTVSTIDTANTTLDGEPDASDEDEMDEGMESTILTQIKLLHAKTSLS